MLIILLVSAKTWKKSSGCQQNGAYLAQGRFLDRKASKVLGASSTTMSDDRTCALGDFAHTYLCQTVSCHLRSACISNFAILGASNLLKTPEGIIAYTLDANVHINGCQDRYKTEMQPAPASAMSLMREVSLPSCP